MKNLILITGILACALVGTLIGCTSVPEVERSYAVEYSPEIKKYDVEIDKDYMGNPEEFKYAINSFVKEQGGTSYTLEKHGENNFFVTIPGKTPVEELPEVKHFHKGKTIAAIVVPSSIVAVVFINLAIFLFPLL